MKILSYVSIFIFLVSCQPENSQGNKNITLVSPEKNLEVIKKPKFEELITSGLHIPLERYTSYYYDGTGTSFPHIRTMYGDTVIIFAYGSELGFGRSHAEDLTIVINPKAIKETCTLIETLINRKISYETVSLAIAKQELWHLRNHQMYGYSEEAELIGEVISLEESPDYAIMRIFTLMREMQADQAYQPFYRKLIDSYKQSIKEGGCSFFLKEEQKNTFNIEDAAKNLDCIQNNIEDIIQNYKKIAELSKK
jgi:hypothetical protein